MHHVALDRAGPDDRDLDHHIVETFRLHPRQRRHLRAALDLETRRSCPPSASSRRSRASSFGMCARSSGRPRSRQSSNVSCSTDIMPRPSRSTFTIPRSSQSSLSHCATTRPGIDAFSSGTNELKLSLADDHPAGVLAEVPRQTVDRLIKRDERRHPRMRRRQPGLLDLRREVHRVREIAVGEEAREAVENIWRKVEHLADLARRAAAAIRDDVRRHGRAVFAVTAINFLDHALAPVAAGQIKIDVRPALPALAQETLEDR